MRSAFLPYCQPFIGPEEIQEVVDSLQRGWVTTGPKVKKFEQDFADYIGVKHAIALSSCTAALHVALAAFGIGPGDEVIVPTLTFCATANVVAHLGATPVLVDVDENFHISLEAVRRNLNGRTRAIIPVHYAGQACDLDALLDLGKKHSVLILEDAAHAVGAEYNGKKIGAHGQAVAFSFYATKNMTTGEGGMLTTNDDWLAGRIRLLSLHGMSRDAWKRYTQPGSWYYEVHEAGYKYNMTDIQAALGIHQLRRLEGFIERRRAIAESYAAGLADIPGIRLPTEAPGRKHTYHLYPLRVDSLTVGRDLLIEKLKQANIGTSVHFTPLHRHPYYRRVLHCSEAASFPVAERIYDELLSLPLYPKMSDSDVADVIVAVRRAISNRRSRRGLSPGGRYAAAS